MSRLSGTIIAFLGIGALILILAYDFINIQYLHSLQSRGTGIKSYICSKI